MSEKPLKNRRLKPKTRRTLILAAAATTSLAALLLAMDALRDTAAFFHTPSSLLAEDPRRAARRAARLGGVVERNSLRIETDGRVRFRLLDENASLEVIHRGTLPDLFREGKGAVVEGRFDPEAKTFMSTRTLAKHDENYAPPENLKALEDRENPPK